MIVTIEIIVTTSANILLIRNGEGSCHQEKVGEEKWPAAGPALLFHIINILIIFVISHHQYSHHLAFFINKLTSHPQRIMMAMLEMNIQPSKARSHEGERTNSTYLPSA